MQNSAIILRKNWVFSKNSFFFSDKKMKSHLTWILSHQRKFTHVTVQNSIFFPCSRHASNLSETFLLPIWRVWNISEQFGKIRIFDDLLMPEKNAISKAFSWYVVQRWYHMQCTCVRDSVFTRHKEIIKKSDFVQTVQKCFKPPRCTPKKFKTNFWHVWNKEKNYNLEASPDSILVTDQDRSLFPEIFLVGKKR